MVSLDADLTPAEAAALHEGLAHPARVAATRALRAGGPMAMADLRRAVSAAHREVDARTMRFHVRRMEVAGLVDVRREAGGDVVVLLRDVALRLRPAPGA
jgi:DNA-binding transcriptional ArsR family regulator